MRGKLDSKKGIFYQSRINSSPPFLRRNQGVQGITQREVIWCLYQKKKRRRRRPAQGKHSLGLPSARELPKSKGGLLCYIYGRNCRGGRREFKKVRRKTLKLKNCQFYGSRKTKIESRKRRNSLGSILRRAPKLNGQNEQKSLWINYITLMEGGRPYRKKRFSF